MGGDGLVWETRSPPSLAGIFLSKHRPLGGQNSPALSSTLYQAPLRLPRSVALPGEDPEWRVRRQGDPC